MRFRNVIYALPVVLLLAGCKKTPPANVAATVNNRPITYDQVDQAVSAVRTRFTQEGWANRDIRAA